MNRKHSFPCLFALSVVTLALSGCGGGNTGETTSTVTKVADTTVVAASTDATDNITVTDIAASPSPGTSPLPDATPCAHPTDRPTPDGDEPGNQTGRPVRGTVKTVDAAALTFVIAAPLKPDGTMPPKPRGEDTDPASPAPADISVTTDSATVFVRKNDKDTVATFADISGDTTVAVKGILDKNAHTLAATQVEILP